MDSRLDEIAIIHLVRFGNETGAAERFVESYLRHRAGHDHKLFFLLKGFGGEVSADLAVILDRVPHTRLFCQTQDTISAPTISLPNGSRSAS